MTKDQLTTQFTNVLSTLPGASPFYVEQCVMVAQEAIDGYKQESAELLDAILSLLSMCTVNLSPIRMTNSDLDDIKKAREIINKYSTPKTNKQ